ncbi:MAG: phosphoribosylformylglycinamidine synthase subunit PurS [Planctomycetota bacterium]
MTSKIEVRRTDRIQDSRGLALLEEAHLSGFESIDRIDTARGYILAGDLGEDRAREAARVLLADPVCEVARFTGEVETPRGAVRIDVIRKPGVMDSVARTVHGTLSHLGFADVTWVRTFSTYFLHGVDAAAAEAIARRVLANGVIEDVFVDRPDFPTDFQSAPATFQRREVVLSGKSPEELLSISRENVLALDEAEMRTVQEHFEKLGRIPTDDELETIAQSWSAH